MKVLLVEDDQTIATPLCQFLQAQHWQTTHVDTLAQAKAAVLSHFDLVLLDWNLGDGDGVTWLRAIRDQQNKIPVILLTARMDVIDKVVALELGAHDYVTKPFDTRELLARMNVQLRLSQPNTGNVTPTASTRIEGSGISIDLQRMEVAYHGTPVPMTQTEIRLLSYFLQNPKRALSRDTILNDVWGLKYPSTRTVDVHVMQLRQKFKPDLFVTIHGLGYRYLPAHG